VVLVELPRPAPDGRVYLTTTQSAQLMNVTKTTIIRWRRHGYLTPIDGSPPNKPMFAYDDVVAAEATARLRGIATSGIDPRDQRDLAA
jgi:hypothetical protein